MFTSRRHKQQTSTSSCCSAWSMCYCSGIRKLSVWNEAFPMNLFPWRFPHSVTCACLQAKYLNISACVTSVPHVTLLLLWHSSSLYVSFSCVFISSPVLMPSSGGSGPRQKVWLEAPGGSWGSFHVFSGLSPDWTRDTRVPGERDLERSRCRL